MAETDVDLRGYTILLVSSTFFSAPRNEDILTSLLDWASEQGHGIYQLPQASYRLTRRPGITDADQGDVDFLHSQLSVYANNGYNIAGTVLRRDDLQSATGTEFQRLFRSGAKELDVELGSTWIVPSNARIFRPDNHRLD